MGTRAISTEGLPLHPSIIMSADDAAQGLIRCSDKKRGYLAYPWALSDRTVFWWIVFELYAAMIIERKEFDRISHCRHWAVASLGACVTPILMAIIS